MAEMLKKEDKITLYRQGCKVFGVDYRNGKTVSINCDDNPLALDRVMEEVLERLTNISNIAIGDTVMVEDWVKKSTITEGLSKSYAIGRRCARYDLSRRVGSELRTGKPYKVIDKIWVYDVSVMVVEDAETTQVFYALPSVLRRVDDEI